MPKVQSIAEIVLNCHNQAATRAFYEEIFGLEFMGKPSDPGPVFLKVAGEEGRIPQMIVLVPLPPGNDAFSRPRALHHLAFEVTPEIYGQIEADLRERGLEVRGGIHPIIPSRTLYVDDPEGNEVEIICRA